MSLSDLTIQKLKSDKNQIFWDTNLPAFGIRVDKLNTMLEQTRKFKCGMVLATQGFTHFSEEMKNAVVTNTAIKLIGGASPKDASVLAKAMTTEDESLINAPPLTFTEHIKGRYGVQRIQVPYGAMEAKQKRHDLYALRDMTRQKYCTRWEDKPKPTVQLKEPEVAESTPPDYSPKGRKKK